MKKMIIRLLCPFFVIILLCGSQNVASASRVNESIPLDIHDIQYYEAQKRSIEQYNQILENIESAYSNESRIYPDNYGGAYIKEETGELVILMTDMQNDNIMYTENVSDKNGISYELCDVSYNELIEAVDIITDNMENLREKGIHIVSASAQPQNGQVVVRVKELSQDKIYEIRKFADFNFLVFQDSEEIQLEAMYNKSCGSAFYNPSLDKSGSIGFPANLNGERGFVTAGHVAGKVDSTCEHVSGNTFIDAGITKSTTLQDKTSISADAAFVKATNDNVAFNNEVGAGVLWGASTYELPLNVTVCKFGCATRYSAGKLISTYTNVSFKDYYGKYYEMRGVCEAEYNSANGDSGGPVVMYDGNYGSQSKYTLIGIHHGSIKNGGNAIFSPYANIVNALGVSFAP